MIFPFIYLLDYLIISILIRGEKLIMQTRNISAMKLIFPIKCVDSFHQSLWFFWRIFNINQQIRLSSD